MFCYVAIGSTRIAVHYYRTADDDSRSRGRDRVAKKHLKKSATNLILIRHLACFGRGMMATLLMIRRVEFAERGTVCRYRETGPEPTPRNLH